MTWECKKCEKVARIWTDPEESSDKMNLNDAAVLGILITGNGFSAMEEHLAAMNILVCLMSHIKNVGIELLKQFINYQWKK